MLQKIVLNCIGFSINVLSIIAPKYCGKLGFTIFCMPMRSKIKPHQHHFLNTAQNVSFIFNGLNVSGYKWGDSGKKILLLHGWQSNSFRWKKTVERLVALGFCVYSYDAPGHGKSEGKFFTVIQYSSLIEEIFARIGTFHSIISHSLGGFASIYTLHNNKQLTINKLVVMGTPGEVADFLSFYQNETGLSERSLSHIVAYFKKTIKQNPDYFSAKKFAASLNVDGLIIHDKFDNEAPYTHALSINAAWKKSKLFTTTTEGHSLKSEAVLDEITNFVSS